MTPLLILLIGVASITETSSQTVDSGQVEDTRWSEVSSDVVKVSIFSLWSAETIALSVWFHPCGSRISVSLCEHLRKHACALVIVIILVDESQKYKKVDVVDTVTSTCDRDRSLLMFMCKIFPPHRF